MTAEARVAFVLFFFLVWCFLGLVPWAVAAVIARGRGALPALPLALAAAAAFGVSVPLAGLRDATGFFLSLPAALVGSALASVAGIAVSRRFVIPPAEERPGISAAPARRPRPDGRPSGRKR